MKHICIILLLALLVSCSAMVDDYFTIFQIKGGFDLYYLPEFDDLNTPDEIAEYMKENVTPKYEGANDVWSSPEETMQRGYGDCEDYALLFANIAYYGMGMKYNIIATDTKEMPNYSVVNGGIPNHIAVEYDGVCYDPYYGQEIPYIVGYLYTFDEVFND